MNHFVNLDGLSNYKCSNCGGNHESSSFCTGTSVDGPACHNYASDISGTDMQESNFDWKSFFGITPKNKEEVEQAVLAADGNPIKVTYPEVEITPDKEEKEDKEDKKNKKDKKDNKGKKFDSIKPYLTPDNLLMAGQVLGTAAGSIKRNETKLGLKAACGRRPLFKGVKRDKYQECASAFLAPQQPDLRGQVLDEDEGMSRNKKIILFSIIGVIVIATIIFLVIKFKKK
jgi:hypothetical protein